MTDSVKGFAKVESSDRNVCLADLSLFKNSF